MLKTIVTLFRGAAFRAEEEFADRSALLILDQQIRDSAAGIERAKRALAVAIAQDEAEGKRLETTLSRIADLEERAVAALSGGLKTSLPIILPSAIAGSPSAPRTCVRP